jgi:hypothetical protein
MNGAPLKILVYKRTHTGDPDSGGRFGFNDCMGTIRNLPFDAVIGVGGTGREPKSYGIDRKVNWVGVNPQRKHKVNGARAGIVTFEKFVLFEDRGPLLHLLAPLLAKRMYAGRRFVFKSMTPSEHAEAIQLLELANNGSTASTNEESQNRQTICKPTKCVKKRRAKRCG